MGTLEEKGFAISSRQEVLGGVTVKVVYPIGYLDAHSCPRFDREIENLLGDGVYNILLNLSGLTYISSVGISSIINTMSRVQKGKGDLKVAYVPDKIMGVLKLVGFHSFLKIYETEEKGLDSFTAKPGITS